jgi:hypothetical protein
MLKAAIEPKKIALMIRISGSPFEADLFPKKNVVNFCRDDSRVAEPEIASGQDSHRLFDHAVGVRPRRGRT